MVNSIGGGGGRGGEAGGGTPGRGRGVLPKMAQDVFSHPKRASHVARAVQPVTIS